MDRLEYSLEQAKIRLDYVEGELEKRRDTVHCGKQCVCRTKDAMSADIEQDRDRLRGNLADIRAALGCTGQTQQATISYIEMLKRQRATAFEQHSTLRKELRCILNK